MSNHLFMGAINKISLERESPKFADKKNHYTCPCCEKDVIFKKGQIKIPHFAHKVSEVKCMFYDKPSETEIHKEAKILMKSLLDKKTIIMFNRKCSSCEHFDIIVFNYNDNDKAVIEYRFNYNESNRFADIALVNDNNIRFIFEICYKNKTKECNRPKPWIEIDANNFIKKINENNDYNFECIRKYTCIKCVEEEIIKENNKILEEQFELFCSCKIQIKFLCRCIESKYELCKLSNNYYCKECNLWKCRCDNIIKYTHL